MRNLAEQFQKFAVHDQDQLACSSLVLVAARMLFVSLSLRSFNIDVLAAAAYGQTFDTLAHEASFGVVEFGLASARLVPSIQALTGSFRSAVIPLSACSSRRPCQHHLHRSA